MNLRRPALSATAALFFVLTVKAQDAPAPASAERSFETQGSVTGGYRFTDVSGRREKYQELLDLRPGFRLFEFDLFGRSRENGSAAADSFSVNASGLGGDPYAGG